jgi:calcium-dependent protein kinase
MSVQGALHSSLHRSQLQRHCCVRAERAAAEVFRGAVAAVQHCHGLGVVHRNVRAEALLLADKGDAADVRLVGFRDARFVHDVQGKTEPRGSAYYLAPECLSQRCV